MRKTLIAAAILGVSVGAQAEEGTQVMFPFAYTPAAPVVDQETVKAWVEMNQKAHEHFVAYQARVVEAQKQARANTPAFLRIPAVPEVPRFDAARFQDFAVMDEAMRADARKESERLIQSFQPTLTNPAVDIDQLLTDRRQEIDAALASAEKRADELAGSL